MEKPMNYIKLYIIRLQNHFDDKMEVRGNKPISGRSNKEQSPLDTKAKQEVMSAW